MIPPIDQLAHVQVSGTDINYGAHCDRCTVNASGEIMLLSVAAPQRIIAGLCASLSRGGPYVEVFINRVAFTDGTTYRTYQHETRKYVTLPNERHFNDRRLLRHPDGYTRATHKLAYNHAHCILVARQPGLLLNTGHKAIERALKDPDVCTTPFLPEWVPYIAGQLRDKKLLNDLWGFQCSAAILRPGSTREIDQIVLEGGRAGQITIPA